MFIIPHSLYMSILFPKEPDDNWLRKTSKLFPIFVSEQNLPEDFTEIVLKGANHAGFGNYGPQSGDGKAEISSKEQQISAGQSIADFILEAK